MSFSNLEQTVDNKITLSISSHKEKNGSSDSAYKLLKTGIWLYYFLLILEGALRKWVFPELASALLIVRDPIAIWLIIMAYKRGVDFSTNYLRLMLLITLISVCTTVVLGHGNLAVAVYGARILILHFPLIFLIGRIFNRSDILKMGIVTLWISIPMAILITWQFYSPQSAWINLGVGGDVNGGGFSGALGYFRPPGTFSFTIGTTLFFGLLAPFVLYFWLHYKNVNKILLTASTISLLAAVPFSISRTLLFEVIISIVFLFIAVSRNPKSWVKMTKMSILIVLSLVILSLVPFFQTATEVFTARFTSASEIEGGLDGTLINRFLGGLINALATSGEQPFFGSGLGMGTNAGAKLLTGSSQTFLIAEGEWGRLVGEMGPLLGITVILIRLLICTKIAILSYKKIFVGDLLPWMLLSFGLLVVVQGQWAQPTVLGFSTIIGGLMIASLKKPEKKDEAFEHSSKK